ncbi:MAG TPA: hypothetical protein VFC99_20230, partial [Acidimicrobiia bacterium]|nr:hypothetical protein [Acidimicrobiia bacterium]
ADGFADVAAKASQRREVRDYIADQATLRLARVSNFVSAARPVVTEAISAAIDTPLVKESVHDFIARAHRQIFRATATRRVDVDSAQAAVTVRTALETINPALAKKLPPNILEATTTVSQSSLVDTLFRASKWIRALYIPVFLAGLGVLVLVLFRARDRVHALRVVGISLAVAGALGAGIGAATPAFASVAATNAPGRGDAVAAFIDVLVGRLVGVGKTFIVVGLLLALTPGHDGGDLRNRVDRMRAWVARRRTSAAWRFAGGGALIVLAALALTKPVWLLYGVLGALALTVLYVGMVVCLRATGLLVTDHTISRLHARQVVAVAAAMAASAALTGFVAVEVVSSNTGEVRANPTNQGCNGYIELCAQRINDVIWPGSHNAMASSAYNFFGAEHTITIPEQLNAGARFLMLDAYYGYDDDGLIRTNLAGGIDRQAIEKERGDNALQELDRVGALTGVADISGKKQDVYFCHDFCELGAVSAEEVFGDIRDFLDRNLTDVVVIDLEDYVKPKDIKKALVDADLFDRVWIPKKGATELPTLYDMVVPKNKRAEQNPRRLIVMSERHPDATPWMHGTYTLSEETPYTFSSIGDFSCAPFRGGTGKDFFIMNHWLRPDGPPDPAEAAKVNSKATISNRIQQCIAERGRVPDVVAVDFTAIGDMYSTVNEFNSAIARMSGVTPAINVAVRAIRASSATTQAQLDDLRALRRLPYVSEAQARKLLGAVADKLPPPAGLHEIVKPPGSESTAAAPTTTAPQRASG